MGRRIANQVHKQAARLLRANYMQKEPLWYQAVLEHPPIPLPPRAPPTRTAYDLPPGSSQSVVPSKLKTSSIAYLEDKIRRRFFQDHPFEAFRSRTLVERGVLEGEHPVSGKNWTRLSQRGRNPLPEDVIRFTVNLYEQFGIPLSKSYASAALQFRTLRSEQETATKTAVAEAEEYGCQFDPLESEKVFEKEERVLSELENPILMEQALPQVRKRWKAILERPKGLDNWSRGQEYVRLWRQGSRPDYTPRSITTPVDTKDPSSEVDHLHLRARMTEQRELDFLRR